MKLKERIRYLFEKYNFSPNLSLSQNFLIDPKIASRIVEEAGLKREDSVLEVGAGTGVLTSYLVERAKKVWAVEIDERLCRILKDELSDRENLEVICKDIIHLDLKKLFSDSGKEKIKVVGNLPYHVASFLLLHFARENWWDIMLFTIQREVADKLLSPPGDKKRGVLTVLMSYYTDMERVIDIPPQAFYPPPRVSSTVVRIRKRKITPVKDEKLFTSTVKAAFSSKRKILLNSIARGLNLPRGLTREVLIKSGISEKKRAEELKIEDFIRISNLLLERKVASKCC